MLPKITIVTAAFNSARTIRQTIDSVIQQSYPNIEYIVIDGGSADGTVDILKEYDDKIAFWVSEPDNGIYDAFNKGVTYSSGDYVLFLGSDDSLYEAATVEKAVSELSGGNVDILSAGVWAVDGKICMETFMDGTKAGNDNYDFSMIPHQGMFTKRELLLQYPFDISYRIAADYLFFLTCFFDKKVKIKYICLPVAFFAMEGASGDTSDQRYLDENARIRQRFDLPLLSRGGGGEGIKESIKACLKMLHIFVPVRYFYNQYVRHTLRRHHCSWRECRWCINRRG